MPALLRVRELRRARDLTLAELARASGVPVSTISELERNERNPRVRHIQALARALGVSVDQLISDSTLIPA